MVAWYLNKYKIVNKDKVIDKRLRRKFYRAYDISNKMRSVNKSIDYVDGFCDGAGVDAETREFIMFISK